MTVRLWSAAVLIVAVPMEMLLTSLKMLYDEADIGH